VAVLAASGAVLYVPALSEAVGQRFWVRAAHLAGAAALALAPVAAATLRWPEVRAVERELSWWSAADAAWFLRPWRVLAGERVDLPPPGGRFNGGQRLFAALVAVALAVLLATGVPMYWWGWFAASVVARSRDLHVLAAFGLVALLAGHVYLGARELALVRSPRGGVERPGAPRGAVRPDQDR
jgi:formate dehydrogenase subunit gamma